MPVKDEVGNTYGYLTVISRAENSEEGRARWLCQCKCGNTTIVLGKHLRSGNTKSCGCYQKERAAQSNMERGGDLTGKRFGRLTVLYENGFKYDSYGKRRRLWHCKCDCGNECDIQHVYLNSGDTNSCGCINSVGNMTIMRWLTSHNVYFKTEYSFKDFICVTKPYRFDFAIFDEKNNLQCLIEYQGDIHFTYKQKGWNTKEKFLERKRRDEKKLKYCEKNNIILYRIAYYDNIEKRLEEIINELQCGINPN